ncbi:alpha/beta fold hydrolase [Georhizobium sp. MAB10]|uniref:alpha/beta fold hydrolase n=1 Tax=Georhizobium sp. MAB10 TaxID=3028319 RepID=UPI0038556D69
MSLALPHAAKVLERDALRVVSRSGTVWRQWGEGAPLVLLHGGAGSWLHWVRNIAALMASYRVLVPDMPGFGESSAADPADDPRAIASRLIDDLNSDLGVKDAIKLVGFSFGGLVAGLIAEQEPQRIDRLVLVGPSGLGLPTSKRLPLMSWRRTVSEGARRAAHAHNLRVLMLADGKAIDDATVTIQAYNAECARLNSRPISNRPFLLGALTNASVPISGIWGAQDAILDDDLEKRFAIVRLADPNSSITSIPHAGHWVQYEKAETFNSLVLELLQNGDQH